MSDFILLVHVQTTGVPYILKSTECLFIQTDIDKHVSEINMVMK